MATKTKTKKKETEEKILTPKEDEIWIPYSELKGYFEHLRGMLTTITNGIEMSMKSIETNAAANAEGDDNNDDKN